MRKFLIFLLFPLVSLAQEGIFKKDGTTIAISKDAKLYPGSNKLYYREPEKRRKCIKYKDLDYAAWDGKLFRSVVKDGKAKGYFLLADEHGHSLAVFVQNKTKYTGGFQSPYKKYEVAELRNGEIIQSISFTNSNRDDYPAKRLEAYNMITRNFANCTKLIDKIPSGDPATSILALLDQVNFIPCN